MIENGVIGSWVPQPDPANFGFPVVAFCSVTITQEIATTPSSKAQCHPGDY